jgi:hypothetical protein
MNVACRGLLRSPNGLLGCHCSGVNHGSTISSPPGPYMTRHPADPVSTTQVEIHDVATTRLARRVCRAKIALVEVDPINCALVFEKPGVLAGATGDIEYRSRTGHKLADEAAQPVGFARVVLKAVDRFWPERSEAIRSIV